MSETGERIDGFLEANLERYVAETAELCALPSVSATHSGLRECAALVGRVLERHGLEVQTFETPGAPVVVGRAPGRSARTLLFYNHYDVQPAEPLELWTSPPFEPTVRDGALFARGAKDDKGELVARLAALDAVLDAHAGELPCGVTFVVEGQEEVGSPHVAAFVREQRELLRCDGAIWEEGGVDPDGRQTLSLGRRGILAVELSVATIARDAHSGMAHALPSAAWRLVWALASIKGPDERVRIPGFYDPVRPVSALDEALLEAAPDHAARTREEFGLDALLLGRDGLSLKRAVFEPTCTIQGITTGYQGAGNKTVIPAHASAKLDFRLVPDQDPEQVLALLRAHLDEQGLADVNVRVHGMMWPDKSPADDPLVELTRRTAEEVYGLASSVVPMTGGSSPTYAFSRPLGIPVVTAGLGYPGSRTHSPDEHIRLSDLLLASRHIARVLDGFADL